MPVYTVVRVLFAMHRNVTVVCMRIGVALLYSPISFGNGGSGMEKFGGGGIVVGLRISNGTSLWFSCVPLSHMAETWVKIRSVSSLSMYYLYLL